MKLEIIKNKDDKYYIYEVYNFFIFKIKLLFTVDVIRFNSGKGVYSSYSSFERNCYYTFKSIKEAQHAINVYNEFTKLKKDCKNDKWKPYLHEYYYSQHERDESKKYPFWIEYRQR